MIFADDMGYGDMSCQGAVNFSTPNLDSMAESGIRFSDMHSSSAVCSPSRYSFLTGRYCWRTRLKEYVLGGFGAPLIEQRRETLASLVKKQGYQTAAIGKWHLGLDWYDTEGKALKECDINGWNIDGDTVDYARGFKGGPCDLGFDEFFGIAGSLDMPPYCYLKNNRPETLPTFKKHHFYPQQREGMQAKNFEETEVDLTFIKKAEEFIERQSKEEEPFFLYLTPSSPHRPCVPPEFLKGKSNAGNRGDMVLMVDHMVGRVRKALEEHNLEKDTLVIFSSDNGARALNYDGKDYGHKSNGDLRGQKGDIYDGGHREPCIAQWPDTIPEGLISDEPLCLVDIFATLADIIDVEIPANHAEDSKSFLPVLKNEVVDSPVHEALVHHSLDGLFSVRKGEWKAVFGNGSGGFSEPARYTPEGNKPEGQLYNIHDDFRETTNLWNDRPEIVLQLQEILTRYQQEGASR